MCDNMLKPELPIVAVAESTWSEPIPVLTLVSTSRWPPKPVGSIVPMGDDEVPCSDRTYGFGAVRETE